MEYSRIILCFVFLQFWMLGLCSLNHQSINSSNLLKPSAQGTHKDGSPKISDCKHPDMMKRQSALTGGPERQPEEWRILMQLLLGTLPDDGVADVMTGDRQPPGSHASNARVSQDATARRIGVRQTYCKYTRTQCHHQFNHIWR